MDRERAIELLKLAVPIKALTQQEYSDFVEAVNMGMDALKEQLFLKGTTKDTISRRAAIDAINSWRGRFSEEYNEAIDDCENSIKELPTIQPEPKEGYWIKHIDPFDGEQYECSECGVLWEFNDGTPEDNEAYYCPNCGAKMKGET